MMTCLLHSTRCCEAVAKLLRCCCDDDDDDDDDEIKIRKSHFSQISAQFFVLLTLCFRGTGSSYINFALNKLLSVEIELQLSTKLIQFFRILVQKRRNLGRLKFAKILL